jgi:kynurenine formamidase
VRDRRDVDELASACRNWGRWGPDDELGTLNFVTPETVAAAAREVRSGQVFSLAIAFGPSGPQTGGLGRFNPVHTMLATGTDAAAGCQDHLHVAYADDVIALPCHGATHWDALGHVFYRGAMWNGYDMRLVSSAGAARNAIAVLRDRLVGRGVLLDVARWKGVDALSPGEGIGAADLDAVLRSEGVEVRTGDFLLVRTGQLGRCRREGWGTYAGGDAPGLALDTASWLRDARVAAVAADTWGCEVRPNETEDVYQPWHHVVIPNMGLTVGEIFDLEDLAAACAREGRYTFFFTAPPLPIEGGVGSPVNPLAVL